MEDKRTYKVDVPVLIIFFCRDAQFAKVFEAVQQARPSKLYLYQDGARKNREEDKAGIMRCRQIAENIDWECEVHRWYQEENVGCDPSEYLAQKWMFEKEDKGIILEDDDVPSESFFRYCKELLDYYENDERIHMICGMNNNGVTKEVTSSYFFSQRGSIWGWATWRRVTDTWDEKYSFLDDDESLRAIRDWCRNSKEYNNCLTVFKRNRDSGVAHYETINGVSQIINGRVNIVPKWNMISNIGVGAVTTHGASDIRRYPKRVQRLFYAKTYELDFPLSHPKCVVVNKKYDESLRIGFRERVLNRVESLIRRIIYMRF